MSKPYHPGHAFDKASNRGTFARCRFHSRRIARGRSRPWRRGWDALPKLQSRRCDLLGARSSDLEGRVGVGTAIMAEQVLVQHDGLQQPAQVVRVKAVGEA